MLAAVLMAALTPASATVVGFASGDGSATSNTGSIFAVTPHPAWDVLPNAMWPADGRPQGVWVSAYDNTGYGEGVVLPNTTVASGIPTMTFWQTFILPNAVNVGSAIFGADDTVGVWLNGNLLKAPNPVQDSACAAGTISCQPGEFEVLNLTPFLVQGVNTLEMKEFQVGGATAASIWAGQVDSRGEVPEPSTLALMTVGAFLVGLGWIKKRV